MILRRVPGLVPYDEGLAMQRALHAQVAAGEAPGTVLLLEHEPVDVVAYVRSLEQVLIDVCADLGLDAGRVEGRSGVWVPDGSRKIAAIGIRVARGTTMHGFALNCDPDLTAYDRIVACGIADA